jgi:hypothetical protein
MNVEEVQARTLAISKQITALVQFFEEATGCIVHSLPILPASGTVKTTVTVKVQIP